jgi:hypothetical protein
MKQETYCSIVRKLVKQSLQLCNLLNVSSKSCSEGLFKELIKEMEFKDLTEEK